MKKKLWCVLCIMICMMMIAACGQKKNPEKKKSEKAEQEETEFKDRESLKLSLFTVYYPKAWNYDKENMKKEEEYSYVRFFDGDTVDGSENVISIEATKEDSYTYRNQLLKLGGEDISSPDKLGSITGMAETENGFVAADGNMREIQFWAKDGTHVGAISTEDIFGVSYPWLEDMQLLDDGSLLIMLTQERDDGSANELMFFRLTGF